MGTSSSHGGPGDGPPLLPDWALGSPDGVPDAEPDGDDDVPDEGEPSDSNGKRNDPDDDDSTSGDNESSSSADSDADDSVDEGGSPSTSDSQSSMAQTPPDVTPRPPQYWKAAKIALGKAVSNRGGQRSFARAGRRYVQARGGAHRAASTSRSARAATGALGRFLSDVASRGINAALAGIGLASVVGKDANTVFAAVTDALAPEGSDREQAATREAISETLANLFDQFVAPDGNVTALDAMDADAVRTAIEASVVAAIYHRWLGDLGIQIEEKTVSAVEAVRLERDMKSYVRDTVRLELQDQDPLNIQWDKADGAAFVDRIYREAYTILGGAQ